MIKIENLSVGVGEKEILKKVNLEFHKGKNYCLLGKNGSGKSTLSSFLMGLPKYKFLGGSVKLSPDPNPLPKGEGTNSTSLPLGEIEGGLNLLKMSPEERSKAGLFLSFQNVPEINGIVVSEYLRIIYNIHLKQSNPEVQELSPFIFKRFIKKYLEELSIDESFLSRELNVGFSGGEKRKLEILQMKLIGPKYIILDEIDSGLDLDAFKKVAMMLKSISNENNCLIIITHYFTILDYIDVDEVYIMKDGEITKKGGKELVLEIKEKGYE